MYNDQLILISTQYRADNIGNQVEESKKRPVLCDVLTIGRREFYAAAATDLKPEIIFRMNKYDYDGEQFAEFNNDRYKVLRQYPVPNSYEEIELTCEKAADNGAN